MAFIEDTRGKGTAAHYYLSAIHSLESGAMDLVFESVATYAHHPVSILTIALIPEEARRLWRNLPVAEAQAVVERKA